VLYSLSIRLASELPIAYRGAGPAGGVSLATHNVSNATTDAPGAYGSVAARIVTLHADALP
jgi:hypothetical protein